MRGEGTEDEWAAGVPAPPARTIPTSTGARTKQVAVLERLSFRPSGFMPPILRGPAPIHNAPRPVENDAALQKG